MKNTIISIIIAAAVIIGALILVGGKGSGNDAKNGGNQVAQGSNVSIKDGKQIVDIRAKGGYSPRVTVAKADVPTTLKINTQGTFDCSTALVIPSLSYRKNLPPSGTTEVEISAQPAGTKLKGLCSMGMYSFEISFN